MNIKLVVSSSKLVMFFLLYRHTDDGIFDDFPKVSEDFPKLFRRSDECSGTFSKISEDFRKLPKTFEEDPKMFRSNINEFKYNLREKLDTVKWSISSLVRLRKIRHSSPGCSFVWILREVYFPVKHSCLCNKMLTRCRSMRPVPIFLKVRPNNRLLLRQQLCGLHSFRHLTSNAWNKLPGSTRMADNLSMFEHKLNNLRTNRRSVCFLFLLLDNNELVFIYIQLKFS